MSTKSTTEKPVVLVRTNSAGVHCGSLASREGRECRLTDARRIWYWLGAHTLHEIALHGCGAGSKISEPVPEIILTEAIEIIPMTKEAVNSVNRLGWGK